MRKRMIGTDRPELQADQSVNNALCKLDKLRQEFQDRFTRRWPRILKNSSGSIDLIIHLHIGREVRGRAETAKFCTIMRSGATQNRTFEIPPRR